MKVYLAGPIAGCSDTEARGWRERAKALRPEIEWLDPMTRDFRGVGMTPEVIQAIVAGDKAEIDAADQILRNAERSTEGSAQETMYAYLGGKRVVAFTGGSSPSPWLRAHAEVYDRLEQAVMAL